MKLPKPMIESLSELMDKVTSGRVKIPRFQRDFVWSLNKSANLLNSIIKGYPVGEVSSYGDLAKGVKLVT